MEADAFLALRPAVVRAYDSAYVEWDGRRFFRRGALGRYLERTGVDFGTCAR